MTSRINMKFLHVAAVVLICGVVAQSRFVDVGKRGFEFFHYYYRYVFELYFFYRMRVRLNTLEAKLVLRIFMILC